MLSLSAYAALLIGWTGLAAVIFLVLTWVPAPYGRFARAGWGPRLPGNVSWLVMESPAVLVFTWLFWESSEKTPVSWCFCLLWNVHYTYRSFLYPWVLNRPHRVPLTVTASGWCFNVMNGFLQSVYLFHLGPARELSWLTDVRFLAGLTLFVCGLAIHVRADSVLRSLRRVHGPGYHVPHGGLFRWISCPNYFGELVEWFGWAVLTWSWPGLVFFLWSAANLVPRAAATHRWYRHTFADYPPQRKAVVPFVL